MCLARTVLIPIAVSAALSALPAIGQERLNQDSFGQERLNNDYYSNARRGALRSVEHYHLYPGIDELRAKHYFQAYADFTFVLGYFPNHPRALLLMAELCETWRSPKCDVDEFFNRAVAQNPKIAETFVIIGIHQERTKRIPAAIESFKRALAIDPNSVNANYNIALTYLDIGQYELANEHAQKAYALGAPLSGLRDRLKSTGHWHPLAQPASSVPQDKAAAYAPSSKSTLPRDSSAK